MCFKKNTKVQVVYLWMLFFKMLKRYVHVNENFNIACTWGIYLLLHEHK
jgi:hypothetical protein